MKALLGPVRHDYETSRQLYAGDLSFNTVFPVRSVFCLFSQFLPQILRIAV